MPKREKLISLLCETFFLRESMSRMLIHVPRMFTESELKNLLKVLPDDFEQTKNEFWDYVDEKLAVFAGKVQRVYHDGTCVAGEAALRQLEKSDLANFKIAKKLVDGGAAFEASEDALLVAESESWLETLFYQEQNSAVLELYEETMKDRDSFLSRRIDESLGADELGVLFLEPSRKISLGNAKIIIMRRFDPMDSLGSWQSQLKSKTKE
jgi:hypothetical protein